MFTINWFILHLQYNVIIAEPKTPRSQRIAGFATRRRIIKLLEEEQEDNDALDIDDESVSHYSPSMIADTDTDGELHPPFIAYVD